VRIMGWADGRPALDYTINNAIGYPMATGPGPDPINHVLPAWDLLSGAYAAFSLMALHHHRTQTGKGGEARVPLSDVAIATLSNLGGVAEHLYTNSNRERNGNSVYGLFGRDFVTADGIRMMIVIVTSRQWKNLVAVLQIESHIAQIEAERGVSFATDDGLRYTHRDALFPLFERFITARTHAYLAKAFDEGGIVHSEYRTMLDAVSDLALVDNNPMFTRMASGLNNPSGFAYPAAGAMATLSSLPRTDAKAAPLNGQHSEEILAERLGIASSEIGRLIDAGVVGLPSPASSRLGG
jgi:2-methylfumaryl-CoA isomerase